MADGILRGLGIRVDLEGNGDEELRAWMRDLAEARGGSESFAGSLNDMEREMIEAAKKIGLGREEVKALIEQHRRTGEIQQFADKYGMAMGEVQKRTKDASREINQFGQVVQAVLAGGLLNKLFSHGQEAVLLAANYESAMVSFEVMLGSAEKAKKVLKDITEFSNATPFTPQEVTASARALMSMGVQAENLTDTMRVVGDVASGVNMSFNELAQIYGKNLSSGTVQMEDLNQLAGRGIPIMKELSKIFFGNEDQVAQVRKLSSQGAISFQHLQQAFQNMTSEGGSYFNMMQRQSTTALGLWSTFSGNVDEVKKSIGQMILEAGKPLLDLLVQGTSWLLKNKGALAVLKIAVLLIVPIIGVLLVGAMKAAAVAAWSMAAGVLAATWPFALIAAGIIALILIIEDLYVWITGGESLIGSWLGPFADVFKKIKGMFVGIWDWIKGLFARILGFFKQYGKYIIMALFPISILFFYWNQISAFISSIPGKIVAFFSSIPDKIMGALQSLGSRIWKFLKGILPDWAIKMVAKVTGEQIEARAGGGPVDSRRPYIVGEEGPELFVPRGSGNIVPNGAVVRSSSSRSTSITIAPVINFNAPVSREDGNYIARKVEEAMEAVIPMVRAKLGLEVG